ncbi:tyrosine phenol-lyase [Candidatus Giovannonibacteria bacterium RIFCSPLOWO2_12_FULL_44_25]|uniref:Tryptophanase n=3 Tax=Parcubacteria group TaxID=1794811 RepID=A0A837IIE2_9BACT|nr:MAG: Tryptophanase [Parcubacteria group bacterium GW2011_GWC1_44_10]KKT60022.1 MAG: Tryptophanase [Candidatus Giovannonibacteria bacterium GW2011_GWA1_44_25]KKU12060.1 MAG: Tryptophanase [Candidatus Azambacteria bacterium GW2011_GWC2_45_7b]KKU30140.1 MAG: Tryptophanase [Candidatus Giovannonibacteria bacterium GW2011_GWB1_46_20]OGF49725.1 MAG: tyrosine phenol-lyase [Candidatus Giovannonibacteria bacterium GWA2_45_15]OGF60294.1 MAG: tyrosine phenol-lyase [Candidatus Giovannonibacteria bacteri
MNLPPYKTKMVEPIGLVSRAERIKKLKRAGYNLFFLNSEDVYIDLLTDSGTGAMSENQWAAMMRGDESYAGSSSFRNLQNAVKSILGFPYIIPTHQGRGAEQVFNSVFVKNGMVVPGNAHFDTTRAHIENRGGLPIDCTVSEAYRADFSSPFKGNVDLAKLEKTLKKYKSRVAYILLTVTCNSVGGQPESIKNIKAVSRLAKKYKIGLFFDIARFAENAYFIKAREKKYKNQNIRKIVREMMSYADGALMSAKKDAIVNMGGFIALKNKETYSALAPSAILMEGFLHYGGMSGRDMEALAQGLWEGTDEHYLKHRISQVEYLGENLSKIGIPILKPVGGHAVYIDAGKTLPHIPWNKFPGQALAIAAYIEGGVRSVEIGSVMEGRDQKTHENKKARMELLRLAVPRRVYSQEHLDYVISIFEKIFKIKNRIRGVKFTYEAPMLRHFSSRFTPTP